jgi:DNA-binding HxlR family transcriptional regulator
VACGLDLFGDRWTFLIIRDLFLGHRRFKDFAHGPEGIPTNILSERLVRLVEAGVLEKEPAAEGSKRLAYRLTRKGEALKPILQAIRDWGLAWEAGTATARTSTNPPPARPEAARNDPPEPDEHFADLG